MKKLWIRFQRWLDRVRYPGTSIRFDEAPEAGVQVTLSYTGSSEKKDKRK